MKRVRKRELPMVGRPEGQDYQRLELPQKREDLCYRMDDPDLHAAVGLCRTKPAGVAHTSARNPILRRPTSAPLSRVPVAHPKRQKRTLFETSRKTPIRDDLEPMRWCQSTVTAPVAAQVSGHPWSAVSCIFPRHASLPGFLIPEQELAKMQEVPEITALPPVLSECSELPPGKLHNFSFGGDGTSVLGNLASAGTVTQNQPRKSPTWKPVAWSAG